MKPIFDPESLTLMTPKESRVWEKYIDNCDEYMDGKVDGVKMKQASVQMANLSRVVQTRSAVALLTTNIIKSGNRELIKNMLPEKK